LARRLQRPPAQPGIVGCGAEDPREVIRIARLVGDDGAGWEVALQRRQAACDHRPVHRRVLEDLARPAEIRARIAARGREADAGHGDRRRNRLEWDPAVEADEVFDAELGWQVAQAWLGASRT